MTKKKIILLVILGIVISAGVYFTFFWRTPERILKSTFDISLKEFDYTIESFEEQWIPFNGNGYLEMVIKFNELTQENIDYIKEFDVRSLSTLKQSSGHSYKHLSDEGYYIYREEGNDFYIFIFDIKNKKAVLYYRFM